MSHRATAGSLLLLFDADCGLCTRAARLLTRLDRAGRLRLVPLQTSDAVADAPAPAILLRALHARDADGLWFVGGAAMVRIVHEIGLLRPLGFLARLPVIERMIELAYALIAANRHRMSRLIGDDACVVDRGGS